MKPYELRGTIAATLTPFTPDRRLNPDALEAYAAHLQRLGVGVVFIGGTTGESHSLTVEERKALTEHWIRVAKAARLEVVVHVGSNCLEDARVLARHAQDQGAVGISAVAPAYFKPRTLALLVDCCAEIASAAPDITFFHYDIPGMTGFSLPMGELVERAGERIPNFGGLKFSNMDLMMLQQCLKAASGRFSVAFGCDESLIAAVALGCRSAVGSTYNFVAPSAQKAWKAFDSGDLNTARDLQYRLVRLVEVLNRRGYLPSAKVLMKIHGVDVGPMRLPNPSLDAAQEAVLRAELDAIGYFGW